MINKYKIGIFKDKEDIEFVFTNDDIIKRTSLFNSYLRAFKRDVSRLYKQYKSHEVNKKEVLNKIQERTILPIEDYFKINKFIKKLLKE